MQRLFLIRHAKSDWAKDSIPDIDRPLNDRGYRDSYFMARCLKTAGITPDLIISSPAVRAASTALIFSRILNYDPSLISLQKDLYDSCIQDYLRVIETNSGHHKNIFLFGHNPVITDVCNTLSKTFIENLPTSSIAGIKFDTNDPKKAVSTKGELFLYDFPKNHPV